MGRIQPTDREAFAGHESLDDAHLIAGERSGLVGTDDGHRTQCLDCGKPADQGVGARHPAGSEREQNRHHGGKGLGDGRNRQTQCGQQHQQRWLAAQQSTEQDNDADCQRRDRNLPSEHGQPVLQWCSRLAAALEHAGDAPSSVAIPVSTTTPRPRP